MTDKNNELTPDGDDNALALFSLPKSVLTTLLFPLLPPSMQEKILALDAELNEIIEDNNVWQGFINKYFPYLVINESYQKHAKKLFLTEFRKLKEIIIPGLPKKEAMQFILASLCGDISLIQHSTLPYASKQMLYIISAANGHVVVNLDDNGIMEAFKRAATIGNEQRVIWFLENYQMTFKTIEQALEKSAKLGHAKIVAYLLDKHQAKMASDSKGQVLKNAASCGHAEVVSIIVNKCDEISAGYLGRSFENAAQNGYASVLIAILAKINIETNYKNRAFNLAAQFGHKEVIEFLLNICPNEISYVDKGSALNYAAEIGAADIVKALLRQAGSDIDIVDKESALTLAASKGYLNVVEYILMTVGNEINANDKEQALQLAQNYGHDAIVEAFKQYNLGHIFKDAATVGQFEVIQWLLYRASNEILPDYKGLALVGAAKNGYGNIVELLLSQAANEIDEYYLNRAIRFAQEQGYDTVISLLETLHRNKKVS